MVRRNAITVFPYSSDFTFLYDVRLSALFVNKKLLLLGYTAPCVYFVFELMI